MIAVVSTNLQIILAIDNFYFVEFAIGMAAASFFEEREKDIADSPAIRQNQLII